MSRKEKEVVKNQIEVVRASEYEEKVFFDLKVNGVTIYGCTYNENEEKGDWIGFPSRKGKDGKWYKYAYVELSKAEIEDIDTQIDKLL